MNPKHWKSNIAPSFPEWLETFTDLMHMEELVAEDKKTDLAGLDNVYKFS